MKKLYKIMLSAFFIFSCFVPFSVFAEEESSSFELINNNTILFNGTLSLEEFKTIILNSPYDLSNTLAVNVTEYNTLYFVYESEYVSDGAIFNSSAYLYSSGSWHLSYNFSLNLSPVGREILFNSLDPITGSENFTNWNGRTYEEFCDLYYSDITVSAEPSIGGVVTGSGRYLNGDYFTVTATPNSGYEFDHWEWIYNGVSQTWDPMPSWTIKAEGDEQYIAHFRYTGLTPPSPTPTPTPTPDPDEPLYEMNTDFKYLLSNPAIATLVQTAVNELGSNTWWIERELYYYESASCPSGSTPVYSNFGYVERYILYNYTSNGLTVVADSLNHQGQSSLGCLYSNNTSTVVTPDLEISPRISETLFFGFDLFEIPEADFYNLLVDIKQLLGDSGTSNAVNNLNNSLVSGNGISQNATTSIVDTNSALVDSSQTYEQFETQFNSNLTSSLDNIDVNSINLVNSNDFVKTAAWVKVQFDDVLDSSGVYKTAISFVLIIGLALLLLGRRL